MNVNICAAEALMITKRVEESKNLELILEITLIFYLFCFLELDSLTGSQGHGLV